MMKYLLFICFFIGGNALAQVSVHYLNDNKEIILNPKKATSYVVVQKLNDSAYFANEYGKDDSLMLRGYYKDSLMKVPNGRFTFYNRYHLSSSFKTPASGRYDSTYVSQSGYYSNGMKNGVWVFYSSRDHRSTLMTFENGDLNGPFLKYGFLSGRVIEEGNYEHNNKEGSWCKLDTSGTVIAEEVYHRNKLISKTTLWKPPVFPDSYRKYLFKKLEPYRYLLKQRSLTFNILIDANGYVTDPIVSEKLEQRLAFALNQILLNSPKLKPGSYNDIAVAQKWTITLHYASIDY